MTSASFGATALSDELTALSTLAFESQDAATVLDEATAAVTSIGPCRAEVAYRLVDNLWDRLPLGRDDHPDVGQRVSDCHGSGAVAIPGRAWGWAFPLTHRGVVEGALVVSAAERPTSDHIEMMKLLANQTAAALAGVALRRRDILCTEQLAKTRAELALAKQQLQSQVHVYRTVEAALGSGDGEQGIADALHELTSLPVAFEDQFGNLRCWSGSGKPQPYPKPDPQRRERQLAVLAARHGPMRFKDRVAVLVSPRGEQLGILAIVDPGNLVTDEDILALHFACTLLGYELSHQRNLVELEESVRREFFDDLLAGTDDEGAVARAEALGHDLRRPQYVVIVHSSAGAEAVAAAATRAAATLHLHALSGRKGQLMVLLVASRPDPRALYRVLSGLLGAATCAIGIGSHCDAPSDVPRSFTEAQRALNVRLHSAAPAGASAYDELGFYRLIDAAHMGGAVEDFIREWLGTLLDYDSAKKSELVLTLSTHLESGGNYDESANALHIHRSTLRYRLARICELTGYELRNVDTRFNLHAAIRAWRFLHSTAGRPTGSS